MGLFWTPSRGITQCGRLRLGGEGLWRRSVGAIHLGFEVARGLSHNDEVTVFAVVGDVEGSHRAYGRVRVRSEEVLSWLKM